MLHTNQKEKQERICSNPKCKELGIYPAPKSRDQLREYLYFCINCIRDFNKSWNYFEGLNEQELEVEIRKSVTWDRPSWKFGTKNINYDFEKAFNKFENKKNIKNKKVCNKKLENAFRILGLCHDTNIEEVKTKYKFLAKIFSFKPFFIIFHYLYEFVAYFLFLKNKHQLNEETKSTN